MVRGPARILINIPEEIGEGRKGKRVCVICSVPTTRTFVLRNFK